MKSIKEFYIKFIIIISLPIFGFIAILLLLNLQTNFTCDNYKTNQNVNKYFIGDSHVQKAIDDKIIIGSKNFSNTSESYFFSYYKLLKLLENNHIDTLYLGYSYHNLSSYYDDFIFGEYGINLSARYFFILPANVKFEFLSYYISSFPQYFKELVKENVKNIVSKSGNPSYLGNFENYFTNCKAQKTSMDKRIDFQFYNNGKLRDFSILNLEYLNKIITECNRKNIKLILLNTPLHKYYYSKIPEQYKQKYSELIKVNNLSSVDFLDVELSDSLFIPDGDHTSSEGTKIISDKLNLMIF